MTNVSHTVIYIIDSTVFIEFVLKAKKSSAIQS